MKDLTEDDFARWLKALRQQPRLGEPLDAWLQGPVKDFFPFQGAVLAHGEVVAGELTVTHLLACGHDGNYLAQLATTFELKRRGSLQWWVENRQPFVIDPDDPPTHSSAFELEEIRQFGLRNVAGHGVVNMKTNAGTYCGFSGVKQPLSGWHLEALRLLAPVLNDLFLAHFCAAPAGSVSLVLDRLTARQKAIVRHVVAGLNDKQIARAMDIAEQTVRNQLAQVYARLGVHKRVLLISMLK